MGPSRCGLVVSALAPTPKGCGFDPAQGTYLVVGSVPGPGGTQAGDNQMCPSHIDASCAPPPPPLSKNQLKNILGEDLKTHTQTDGWQ